MKQTTHNSNPISATIAKVLCVLWSIWIVLDYLAHHTYTTRAIVEMPYAKLIGFLLIIGIGSAIALRKYNNDHPKQAYSLRLNGLMVFGIVQLLSVIILMTFNAVAYMPDLGGGTRIGYFLITSTGYLLAFSFIIFLAYLAGQTIFRVCRSDYPKSFPFISIAIGFSFIGTVATLLGIMGWLKLEVVWALSALLIVLEYRAAGEFWSGLWFKKQSLTLDKWWSPLLIVLLLSVVSINWIGAFKTFPIGYDGAALYTNLAFLTADAGQLPAGGQAFNWSVIMSLGGVFFKSRILIILLSNLMFIFCGAMIYRIARLWLSPTYSLATTLLPISSPFFAYHTLVDEKIDLGFAFIVLSGLYFLLKPYVDDRFEKWRNGAPVSFLKGKLSIAPLTFMLLLTGWLAGFAFGIKYTAVMYLIGLSCLFFYFSAGKLAYTGSLLTALGLIFILRIYRFGYIQIEMSQAMILGAVLLLAGLGLLGYSYRADLKKMVQPIGQIAVIIGMFTLAYLPWAVKNVSEHGRLAAQTILEGKEQGPDILIRKSDKFAPLKRERKTGYLNKSPLEFDHFLTEQSTDPVFGLEAKARPVFQENTSAAGTGVLTIDPAKQAALDEIQRYLGFETSFWLYATLPYDLMTNTNVPDLRYLDIGFFFLLLLPILLLLGGEGSRSPVYLVVLPLFMIIWIALVCQSVFAADGTILSGDTIPDRIAGLFTQHPGGTDTIFYSIYTGLLSIFLGIAEKIVGLYRMMSQWGMFASVGMMLSALGLSWWIARERIAKLPSGLKVLMGFLMAYVLIWWLIGNGIIWYGMPIFLLLPVFILHYIQRPEQLMGSTHIGFSRWFGGSILGLALLVNGLLFFTSAYPSDNDLKGLFRWPFVDYISNPNANEDKVLKAFTPVLPDLLAILNKDLSENIYRVNTNYGFHIMANDRRVFSDPALGKFSQMAKFSDNDETFFKVLKDNGFKYIMLDLKMGLVDKSPEQSLRKNFVRLAKVLLSSNQVKLLVTDNYIADPNAQPVRLPNGQTANARYGLDGQTLSLGTVALFELQ